MQIIGLGTLVTMPMVGNLSDKYGRKALLAVPMTLTIIPLGMYALPTFILSSHKWTGICFAA
jgi:MFS family permease